MIALVGVDPERHLHAAANVFIIAVADLDHLVAQDGIGNPGDDPLQHVVVVELAGQPARALRLRPIADLGGKCDNLHGLVLPAEIPVGGRRVIGCQARLDEARRIGPNQELTIASDVRR